MHNAVAVNASDRPAGSSLTLTERTSCGWSVGLSNKDIAKTASSSPCTVQTHLTHVYAKSYLASRGQLVDEAARRGSP